VVVNEKHVWLYYPKAREVQHMDLEKGKGKSGTGVDSFMSWLSFDLEELEKTFKVRVSTAAPPEGVTIRKEKPATGGGPAGKTLGPAIAPSEAYRIGLVRRDPKLAPDIARLSVWVDGRHPWPLIIEQEDQGGDVTTFRFADIVLDAPVEPSRFEFKRPRRTKVVELGE
jgi:outer membrane lipoprotein-sorting protein